MIERLKLHPFCEEMDASLVKILATGAEEVKFSKDEVIFRQDHPADVFYLLEQGSVTLSLHVASKSILIETLHGGMVLGASWLSSHPRWNFDATASEDCLALQFNTAFIKEQCNQNHELGYHVLSKFASVMIERLQATRLQLIDIYGR